MNIKDRTLWELYARSTSYDFKARIKEYHEFIDTLILLTDKLHDAKIAVPQWQSHMEVLLVKFTFHSSSLALLLKGTPIKNIKNRKTIKYPDIGSVFLLSRAQLESYLMFYYLNVQPKTPEEGEFRYMLYEVSGLAHRQEYPATLPEHIAKKASEKKDMDDFIDKIKQNTFFQGLSPKEQKRLLEQKPARTTGWKGLIESSPLQTETALHLWRLQSNYAHSEMVSAMQIKTYFSNRPELDKMLFFAMERAMSLVCVAIKHLNKMYNISEITYNALPVPLTTKIDFWERMGTGQIEEQ